jgi:hypothetical protein
MATLAERQPKEPNRDRPRRLPRTKLDGNNSAALAEDDCL